MSFRGKSAWASLLIYLAVYGYYFWRLFGVVQAGHAETFHYGALLTQLIVLLVILEIVLQIAIALPRPKEAQAARDEREKLIMYKATRVAFHVAMIGAALGAVASSLGATGFYVANGLFLAMVLAEIVRAGGQIVYFRLGA